MTHRTVPTRALMLFLVALAAGSCGVLPSESSRRKPVTIAFSRVGSGGAFPGAYVSVLDTAVLNISYRSAAPAQDTAGQTYRARVGERDSVVVFEVDLDTGMVTFNATVLSNNGTRVFAETLTTQMNVTTDSVTIPLRALTPVMVLSLQFPYVDSLVVGAGAALIRRIFSATIHNRGRDSLAWTNQTDLRACLCSFSATTGKVGAGQSGRVFVTVQTSPASAPTAPPRITLSSTQGRVVTP